MIQQQSEAQARQSSRRGFLRSSTITGLLATPIVGALAGNASGVFDGLNEDARRVAKIKKDFKEIQKHENDHVAFLKTALGGNARPKPTFKGLEQSSYASFVAVSTALENTGVGAYLGAARYIKKQTYLLAAASIVTVEARHAGFLNDTNEVPLSASMQNGVAGASFDQILTDGQVRSAAGPFIADLNGGGPVDYAPLVSDNNDLRILNFALALEYLEAEFYNINVPKFFG